MEKSICCEEFVTVYHYVNITGAAFENLNLQKENMFDITTLFFQSRKVANIFVNHNIYLFK